MLDINDKIEKEKEPAWLNDPEFWKMEAELKARRDFRAEAYEREKEDLRHDSKREILFSKYYFKVAVIFVVTFILLSIGLIDDGEDLPLGAIAGISAVTALLGPILPRRRYRRRGFFRNGWSMWDD